MDILRGRMGRSPTVRGRIQGVNGLERSPCTSRSKGSADETEGRLFLLYAEEGGVMASLCWGRVETGAWASADFSAATSGW